MKALSDARSLDSGPSKVRVTLCNCFIYPVISADWTGEKRKIVSVNAYTVILVILITIFSCVKCVILLFRSCSIDNNELSSGTYFTPAIADVPLLLLLPQIPENRPVCEFC